MSEYAGFVGWDWADEEHQITLRARGSDRVEGSTIPGRPEAIHNWAIAMRRRFRGERVAVCLEAYRGAVVWALMGYEHLVLFLANPKAAADFRKSLYPSGKKDDPVDSAMLLEYVEKHHEKLRRWNPADPATRALGMLSEHRRKLRNDMTRATNRLRGNLKRYYPQALELAGELDAPMASDFLSRWPDLGSVRRARPATVRTFYAKHGSRSDTLIGQRLDLLQTTVELTDDETTRAVGVSITRSLVTAIRAIRKAIRTLDRELAQRYHAHLEHDLIDSLPGAGPVLGPRLIALLGSDRSRFNSAGELQQITGIAPITHRSGGRNGTVSVHRRLIRSKFLHQTIVEWAGCAIQGSDWVHAYYDLQLERGSSHWSALRAIGFKLLRILFICWKVRTPYDEIHHQQSLINRGSPIAARLENAA